MSWASGRPQQPRMQVHNRPHTAACLEEVANRQRYREERAHNEHQRHKVGNDQPCARTCGW